MNQLVKVSYEEFGLDQKQASAITKGLEQIISERQQLSDRYAEVIKMEITPENIKIFKELRLKIRDNRTKGFESWHKVNKEFYLRGGQYVDAIKRKEIEENLRMEANLEENEKFFERKEAERIEKLNNQRISELEPFNEFVPTGINFGTLSDDEYSKIYNGAKLQYDAKIEAEKQAEQARLEAEKAEQERIAEQKRINELRQKRKDEAMPFWYFISDELKSKDLAEISDEEFSFELENAKTAKAEHEAEVERLKKAEEEAAKKLAEEKAEKDRLAAELEEKERAEKARIAEAEKAEKDRLAKEEQDRIERQKAEEEAKKAPIKTQLTNWVDSFGISDAPIDSEVSKQIIEKFNSFKSWAKAEIKKM